MINSSAGGKGSGFSSRGSGTNNFTMQFTNYGSNILVAEWINPPSYAFPGGYYAGHPIFWGAKITHIEAVVHRFTTDNTENDLNLRFRYIDGDGSYTQAFAPGDGTILTDFTISYPFDLNNIIHYNLVGGVVGSWQIPANSILFAYVQFKGFEVVSGINILVHGEYNEGVIPPQAP